MNRGFSLGGAGATELAESGCGKPASAQTTFHHLTPEGTSLSEIRSRRSGRHALRRGRESIYLPQAEKDLARMDELGFGIACRSAWRRPICRSATTRSPLNRPRGNCGCRFELVSPERGRGLRRGPLRRYAADAGLGTTPNFMGVDIDAERANDRAVLRPASAPFRRGAR